MAKPLVKVTPEYVESRKPQLLLGYEKAMCAFGHSAEYIAERLQYMATRFEVKDFKIYGDRPIHLLHAFKRIVRNAISHAIKFSPARKAQEKRLRAQYSEKCAAQQEKAPWLSFFSFEHAHASFLRVSLAPHKAHFKI